MGLLNALKNTGKEIGQVMLTELQKQAARLARLEERQDEMKMNQERILANQEELLSRLPKRKRPKREPNTR